MKQDEIIEMARQAGLKITSDNEILPSYFGSVSDGYFKFAKLVADKEREACMKLKDYLPVTKDGYLLPESYADAIRERGEA